MHGAGEFGGATEHLNSIEFCKSLILYVSVYIKSYQYFIVSVQQCYATPAKFIPKLGGAIDDTFNIILKFMYIEL